ncbi:methionyl-tRNA formyltransferase [Halodesulfovibrio aestuarii]|uniref:methionyl-tRNA formyltransferase n=1 Tax=Halodesulfovibrio aestuarii TaxID=126333 RepID=UPI00042348F8
MRLGYFADGPWAHRALDLIAEDPTLQVAFIVPRYDVQDPILREKALKLGIPFICHENVNSPDFIGQIEQYRADLFVSMSFNQILKKEIIKYPSAGFINCHAGALPFYRGRNPLNWVLINGEEEFGITVHYVDEGIDTGDIIEQRLYPISVFDTYGTLLERAISECGNVLHLAIRKITTDNVEVKKQNSIHPVGTYFGRRTIGDEFIDFNWNAKRFFDFVRGITTPGPGARCFLKDKEYAIWNCELIPYAPSYIATVGEVVGRCERGVVVKVGDSTVLVTSVSDVSEGKNGEQMVPQFPIGTRFTLRG